MTEKFLTGVGLAIVAVIILAAVAFFTGFIVMLLWNWLMPFLFALPTVNFIQGWGIAFLSSLLFKGTTTTSKS
jgi:hypothetical protein